MVNTHKLKQEVKGNKFQFTFFSEHHKPVACIIETEKSFVDVIRNEQAFYKMALVKVCQKRGWTYKDFKSYGYGKYKFRRAE